MLRVRLLLLFVAVPFVAVLACGSSSDGGASGGPSSSSSQCTGGCEPSPDCNPDGTRPPAPCSCPCQPGETKGDLYCTANVCFAPKVDAGADAGVTEDAAVTDDGGGDAANDGG